MNLTKGPIWLRLVRNEVNKKIIKYISVLSFIQVIDHTQASTQRDDQSSISFICIINLILIFHMIKQEIDQPETIAKACEENENADHQIKASNMESVITNEISAEGNKTPESSRKSSNDVDEKDQCITTQEEEENITRSADREFKTESN